MDLTIIILNYNTSKLLRECLSSILGRKWTTDLQIWVVDNASTDDSVEMVKKNFPGVTVLQSDRNLGFAAGNNLALKKATSEYVLLLNSDTIVSGNTFDDLVEFARHNEYGIASCKLLGQNQKLQPNTGDLPYPPEVFFWISGLDDLPIIGSILPSFHKKVAKEGTVGWVAGTVMLLSKEVINKIGLLDEALFMYAEDVDYCLRAKSRGFRIGWTDKAQVIHLGGGSLTDPNLGQWLGEFRGLVYIYRKHFGIAASVILKLIFYIFVFLRIIAFTLLRRFNTSKTYAKVLFNI